MKEITLIFNGLGYHSICQANILLYDNLNNLIYEGKTYNGQLKIKLKRNSLYKIVVYINNELIETYIYTINDKYCFSFNRSIIKYNSITFILTDYYYNLPIERGELILWQR